MLSMVTNKFSFFLSLSWARLDMKIICCTRVFKIVNCSGKKHRKDFNFWRLILRLNAQIYKSNGNECLNDTEIPVGRWRRRRESWEYIFDPLQNLLIVPTIPI